MDFKLSKNLFLAVFCTIAILMVTVRSARAQSTNIDWKYYGRTPSQACFFEAQGIERLIKNHIRVWIECLSQNDLDNVNISKDFDGKILEESAKKIADYYISPISLVQNFNHDQNLTVTTYEAMANLAGFEPKASIFYEISCTEKRMRTLSISITSGRKQGSIDKTGDWQYAPPQSNGDRLIKILCKAR